MIAVCECTAAHEIVLMSFVETAYLRLEVFGCKRKLNQRRNK
jgi:hypothetical protein